MAIVRDFPAERAVEIFGSVATAGTFTETAAGWAAGAAVCARMVVGTTTCASAAAVAAELAEVDSLLAAVNRAATTVATAALVTPVVTSPALPLSIRRSTTNEAFTANACPAIANSAAAA